MHLYDRILGAQANGLAGVDTSGTKLTYGELIHRAEALSSAIGVEPRLVLLEADTSTDWLVSYVACLAGNHPVILLPKGAKETIADYTERFRAAVGLFLEDNYRPRLLHRNPAAVTHDSLAVMLSTSGSAGSAKLVRLSRSDIVSNAQSITLYLDIKEDERGVVNLPTHYSYALSIVNSHLHAGAALLFTGHSVIKPEFWDFCSSNGATSFAGVPQSYELLERIDMVERAPKTLRYFTQAGGRLPPELVLLFTNIAQQNGWRFYVMYGQTEASPRMAYLPSEQAKNYPDCIGIAIPGGQLSLVDELGQPISDVETEGELVYEGPNVMMGYATSADDLALPPGPSRLQTGDLAMKNAAGLFRITGRVTRFIKISGNRIGLDDVEHLLRQKGFDAIATGSDNHMLVVTRTTETSAISSYLSERLKLPAHSISVRQVDDYPLLPTGKIDYVSLKKSPVVQDIPAEPAAENSIFGFARKTDLAVKRDVPTLFAEIFGSGKIDENASFNSLSGDSLNFVTMALSLEELISPLPENWPTLSIGALSSLASRQGEPLHPSIRSGVLTKVDTVRALACLLVVAYHVVGSTPTSGLKLPASSPWHHAVDSLNMIRMPLFTALAGYMYAAMPARPGRWRNFVGGKLRQLGIPLLFATLFFWAMRTVMYHEPDRLLAAYLYGYRHLWYLDTLLVIFAFAACLDSLKTPPIWPWVGIMLIFPMIALRTPHIGLLNLSDTISLLPHFVFGMLLYRAPDLMRSRLLLAVSAIAVVAVLTVQQLGMIGYPVTPKYGYAPWLCGWGVVVVLLQLSPRLPVFERIAAYSFTIYLWHPAANALARTLLGKFGIESIPLLFFIGLLAGMCIPVAMHIVLQRFPRLSLPVIGR